VLCLLLCATGGLRPNSACEIEVAPTCAERLHSTAAGQQQQPHNIRGLLVRVLGKRLAQRRDFSRGEIALALLFVIALDALRKIVGSPAPPDGLREHPRQYRDRPIRRIGRTALRDPSVHAVDVGEDDVGDFDVPQLRPNVRFDDPPIVALRRGALFWHMLLEKPIAEIGDRFGAAIGFNVGERVLAAIDPPP
jgi:hypothetical protein